MPVRGRYSPFNLIAFNKRLNHNLLADMPSATNDDHDGRYMKLLGDNSRYELVKSGNVVGDDGNWSLIIVGDNCELQVKVSGVWKIARKFNRPK